MVGILNDASAPPSTPPPRAHADASSPLHMHTPKQQSRPRALSQERKAMPDIRNSRFDRLRFALIRGRNKRDPIFYLQRTLQNPLPPTTTTTTKRPSSIDRKEPKTRYFLRNEHPSVRRAFPPVGWHSTVEQPPQMTTVCACEKTVVIVKQPGHLTSMKKERGAGTSVCGNAQRVSIVPPVMLRSRDAGLGAHLELVLARLGLRGWVEEIDGENLGRERMTVSSCLGTVARNMGIVYHVDVCDG